MKFLVVFDQRGKFLGSVVASVRETVFQHESGHASCGQILGRVGALAGDGERHEPSAGADDHCGSVPQLWRRLEHGQARLGDVSDDFRVPEFREVRFLRIVLLREAWRSADVEWDDILCGGNIGGTKSREKGHYAKGAEEKGFHGRIV